MTPLGRVALSHPVFDTIEKLRRAYLSLGFKEVVNPLIIEEAEIYRQWAEESPVILDRCYYLAGLPRPDVGMSAEKIESIRRLGIAVDEGTKIELQRAFHRYKKGEISSEELMVEVARVLSVSERVALEVMDKFPELRGLEPTPTRLTLRSHMTSGWFESLKIIQERDPLPVRLFSIDRCFRREQREDETHLRTHHSASCVVMDGEVDVRVGEEVARGLLRRFGIESESISFRKKRRSASYYSTDTETEVFARYKGSEWVEVADFGMYNPEVLKRYEIRYPVMNLGLGAERLAMLTYGVSDIRELVYPHVYAEWVLSDAEIARLVRIDRVPETRVGKAIERAIVATCEGYATSPAPCEYVAFEGTIRGRRVKVVVREGERGKRLLGPAAFNEIVVHNGNVLGLPRGELGKESELIREAREKGTRAGITYLDGISNLAAAGIEEAAKAGKERYQLRTRIARQLSDVNISLFHPARRYITSKKKLIDVRGPVFLEVIATFTEMNR